MPTETELKLAIDPKAIPRVVRQAIVRNHAKAKPRRQHLLNTYYDTANLRLLKQGVGLRIRRAGGLWLQTVKTANPASAGLHQRGEWETRVKDNAPDLSKITDPHLGALFSDEALRTALKPLFYTDFWRTTWLLAFADGSEVELAVDHGEIRADGATSAISEVELELKGGAAGRLFEVAHALSESLPVRLENASKAQRGYDLLAPPAPPVARKAGAFGLESDVTAEQAFVAIAQHCLGHLHDNAPVVLTTADVEGVHQVRVATRRLRSCLSLYRALVPREASGALEQEARWLTGELAAARDWDVLIAETLEPMRRHFPADGALQALHQRAEELRQRGYTRARAALASPRYTRLLLAASGWLSRRDWRDMLDRRQLTELDSPARDFAARTLERRHAKVRKRGQKFAGLGAAQRHRLRIQCKKLRYAGEFFAELYPDSPTRPYLRALAGLQDVLGYLNDAAVAEALLTELGGDAEESAANLVRGWKAASSELHIAQFDNAWQAFTACERFWV